MATTNAQGMTPQEMSALAEKQMRDRTIKEAQESSGSIQTGGQLGSIQTSTQQTPVNFQAYHTTDTIRRDAGIQEVARLNNISYAEAANRYDRASKPVPKNLPPGTVYNPATDKAYDPLSGMEYAGSTSPNFQGMRFVDPGTQKFMGTGMSGQQTGLPASTAMGVPAGASGAAQGQVTEDPEMAFWRTQQEQAKLRLNQTQAALNQQFEQMRREREAQQKSQQGQASMQLARMGAFSAASGVSYGAALQSRHANELQQLEMERQNALLKAQNEADEVGLKFAMKSLERAKELKTEQQKIADRQLQDVERYKKLQAIEKEDLAETFQGMVDGGMVFEDLPPEYLKTRYPELDEFTAKALFSSVTKDIEAKNAKTRQEQLKADNENLKTLMDVFSKTQEGGQIKIGDATYTVDGKLGDFFEGKEVDKNGNVMYFQVDKRDPNKRNVVSLGIQEQSPGWENVKLDDGSLWRINKLTGEREPYLNSAQAPAAIAWADAYPAGTKGPVLPGNPSAAGQCGAAANYWHGTRVWGNSWNEKMDFIRKNGSVPPEQVQVGDHMVMTAGDTGHVAVVNAVYRDRQTGEMMATFSESNIVPPGAGLLSHNRPMRLTDPRITGFTRLENPNLPRAGGDVVTTPGETQAPAQPGILGQGLKKKEEKELSLTELEKVNKDLPPEKRLSLGATSADAAAAGYKPGAEEDKPKVLDEKQRLAISKSKEKTIIDSSKDLIASLDKYKELVNKYGFESGIPFTGSGKSELESAYADLKIKYKEAAELGALTGPDMKILEEAIKPATGFSGIWSKVTAGGNAGIIVSIESARNTIKNKATRAYDDLVSQYGTDQDVYIQNLANGLITPTQENKQFSIEAGGTRFTFASQQELDAFKKEAGL